MSLQVPFIQIPDTNRVPGTGIEFDARYANVSGLIPKRIILIGTMIATGPGAGTAVLNQYVTVPFGGEDRLFGAQSQLADMVKVARKNDPDAEIICLVLDNADPAMTAATGDYGFDGVALEDGSTAVYVGGRRCQVAILTGDTGADVINALEQAMLADGHAKVENITNAPSGTSGGTLTFDAVVAGEPGNTISIVLNQLGWQGGQSLPAGLTFTSTPMSGGAGAPNMSLALTNLGNLWGDYWASGFSDAVSLNAIEFALNPTNGRWAWNVKIYGHCYAARNDTLGNLQAFGLTRNNPYISVMGVDGMRNPSWEWAAAYAAKQGKLLNNAPAAGTYQEVLECIWQPEKEFIHPERNTLYYSGIATFYMVDGPNGNDGKVRIDKCVSTYRTNGVGGPDDSYLLMNTVQTLTMIARRLDQTAQQFLYNRILVGNNEVILPGSRKVNPRLVKGAMVGAYAGMQASGWVENMKAFIDNLIVEKDPNNPNRVNILWGGDLANPLLQMNFLLQFRQEYGNRAALAA